MEIKKIICLFLTVFSSRNLRSQVNIPHFNDSLFSTYYHQRVSHFKSLPVTQNDIIFLGNSITDGSEWNELFQDQRIKNRGISGDHTIGVLNRLDEIIQRKPSKVFLMIGINDLRNGMQPDSLVRNIFWIHSIIKYHSPKTKLYVQSLLPVNENFGKFVTHTNKKAEILEVNRLLQTNEAFSSYTYIDLFTSFCDSTGRLNKKYTNDGLHLTGAGYIKWKEEIGHVVYDYPALIPKPQSIQWNQQKYSLSQYHQIICKEPAFKTEALILQKALKNAGTNVPIEQNRSNDKNAIEIINGHSSFINTSMEAYSVSIRENKIIINANTSHGVFDAIQTIKQLIADGKIQSCEILDWPSFPWRAFMIDVGRNHQSIEQIKEQIEVMSNYKLNIFHLHLTEDIAWRLQSKKYPQLNAFNTMLRNPGKFYSYTQLKELIRYCKQRHITLIPEIDMPGHSAAFTKALGMDMQTEAGLRICKNILTELCSELEIDYVHIGGDEVNITYKEFLPEICNHLTSLGKKVIAWDPGGHVTEGTILQMWNGKTMHKPGYPSVDSRHLYLNHFDPIDGVVSTFNHQICDVLKGDELNLGATLCNWPDRNVKTESDLIAMNAVYPVMLTFAEKCWRGGGYKNYETTISYPGTEKYNAFTEFENRLLEHKKHDFQKLPFPYQKQNNIEWKLIGPFDNKGLTAQAFDPETVNFFDTVDINKNPSLWGGTIWLRHFWHPMIQSHLSDPPDSSTYYAVRKIWSEKDENKNCWISFFNPSRSTATDSPPLGKWDNKNSDLWVNGNRVDPPNWAQAGQKGKTEIPLIDESYEYRSPHSISFKKGWNTILIKAPVGSFKSTDSQNPVKWMFTFITLQDN